MRVPVYGERQVSLRPEAQQGINVQATPGAFGADIGAGMGGLARGMGEAAAAVERLRDFQGTLKAKDALTEFERDKMQLEYGKNGYLTTQGANAAGGYDKYTADLEELKKKHGAKLTGVAAQKYDDAATGVVTSGMKTGIVHSAQGTKDWAGSSSTARLSTLGDQALAAYARPEEVQKNIALGFAEINEQGQMMGWGQDVLDMKKREFASGVHTNVALAMASQPNGAGAAISYLNKNAALIETKDRLDLETKLKPYADEEKALGIVTGLMGQGRAQAPAASSKAGTVGASGPTAARADLLARAKSAGKGADHVDGLTEDFATNLSAMFQDAPPDIRDGLQVGSGYRSIERQQELWDQSDKTGKMVARPGHSQHNHGNAVDIWYKGQRLDKAPAEVREWVHANAGNYGLRFPMSYEQWHIEPNGARSGGGSTVVPSGSGVSARATMPSYDEAMATINAIEDPAVRAAAMKQLNAQFEMRSKAETMASNAAKSDMWSMVAQGVPVSQIPLDLKIAAGREAVSGFMEYESKAGEIKTDPIMQRNLTLFAATDPVAFSKMDLTAPEIINNLSRADLKALTDTQASALKDERKAREDGLNISAAMTFARTQLDGVGISTTGLDGTKRHLARREATFQMALADEMRAFTELNKGRKPTQADIMKMTNRLLLPIVIKTPGTLWDSNQEGFAFEAGKRADGTTVDVVVKYADIPLDLRRGIATDLENELGRKPSEDEIVQRYEDFILSR